LTHQNICLEEADKDEQEQYVADLNKEALLDLNERFLSILEQFVDQYVVYETVRGDISHIRVNLQVDVHDIEKLRIRTLETAEFFNNICKKYHISRVNKSDEEE
jgi:hypothetical protein